MKKIGLTTIFYDFFAAAVYNVLHQNFIKLEDNTN